MGIAHLVDVADTRRHRFDLARRQAHGLAGGDQRTAVGAGEALGILGAAQHADQSPDPVIVNRRALARPPDEADHGEALAGIGMQQELLVALGAGLGQIVRQPVVVGDQLLQQVLPAVEDGGLVSFLVKQFGKVADEGAKAVQA